MKKGFTLGELTITLIIITMVVIVTLPITLNKMKKVDSYSYYMGYNVAQDIWANLSSDLIPDENTSSSSDDGIAMTAILQLLLFLMMTNLKNRRRRLENVRLLI